MTWRIEQHDVSVTPWPLEDESVQCVVTSPPYWGLRDYGTARWEGGSAECDHRKGFVDNKDSRSTLRGSTTTQNHSQESWGDQCRKCGAHRLDSQIGLEPTPADYVEKIVSVFREVRRVLRKDGSVWLNLGDCYATSPPGNKPNTTALSSGLPNSIENQEMRRAAQVGSKRYGLKPKDLVGIPWRVAFALQADGWWLRSDIVWAKPNPMPESIRDRPTRAHEYVFLLTKSRRYFYDADAIREPYLDATLKRLSQATFDRQNGGPKDYGEASNRSARRALINLKGRAMPPQIEDDPDRYQQTGANARTVWQIATEPFPEAHFATFPTELARRCILAGTSIGDTILDPFSGAGTVVLVADILDRDAVGLELNPEYVEMSRRRISAPRSEGEAERRGREDAGQMTWLDGTA